MEYIKRERYLNRLIDRMWNGDVKIITGSRRVGKSWLLSHIFRDYLIENGVMEDEIIIISFDLDDEEAQNDLRKAEELKKYLFPKIAGREKKYYVLLDEIQEVEGFERIVNSLAARENVDVYITGSNSRFLSNDINTIFRGRGDEVRVFPLTFDEFCQGRDESETVLWKEYYTYGGMPGLRTRKSPEQKVGYLKRLWQKTYISDVVDRYGVRNVDVLESLVDALSSAIGSLTNVSKLSNTIISEMKKKVDSETIARYISMLEDAYLFEGAQRYDIKGRRYFGSIRKYYAIDLGLRNARLNFRQQEPTHIMENIIYNHLRVFGNSVDVGVVPCRESHDGKQQSIQYEVDFIATDGIRKMYIQSAYRIDDEAKREQEVRSLLKVDDSFEKIVIVDDDIAPWIDDNGIKWIGLRDFLTCSKISPF